MVWWKAAKQQPNMSKPAQPAATNRLWLQVLEPRMMFDGVAVTTVDASATHHADSTQDTADTSSAAHTAASDTSTTASSTTTSASTTSTTSAASTTTSASSVTTATTTTAEASTAAATSSKSDTMTAVNTTATVSDASTAAHTTTNSASSDLASAVIDASTTHSAANAPQVVFIESDVANYQTIISQLPSSYEVVVLDSNGDGLAQIAQWASTHSGYGAMHIISHGEQNDLMLGTLEVTSANVASHQSELTAIGQSLAPGGDILLYGCDIAAGTTGVSLINALAQETQRSVAGSTDATGGTAAGGDSVLEYGTDTLHVATLDLSAYDGILSRPISGSTTFSSSQIVNFADAGSQVTASDVSGWDFTLKLASADNGSAAILVDYLGTPRETLDGASDGFIPITNFSVKSNDGSTFTLNSVNVIAQSLSSGGTGLIELIGYLNGQQVGTLTRSVIDVASSRNYTTFDVSSNSAFKNIDSFSIQGVSGTVVYGALGFDTINATNFHFGPALITSASSGAYSAGNGSAVVVDSGLTLSDAASTTQSSATVSITGNFHSGEDVLAFTNTSATTYGNIVASYNSSTGVLSFTSSGNTATNSQWQAALEAVTYQDTSSSPSTATRTISFTISDGTYTSAAVTKSVTVAADVAPVITNLNGDSSTFAAAAGGGAVHLDTGTAALVTDSDSSNFNSGNLTVHISANAHSSEDVLGVDTSGTLTLSSGTTVGSTVSVGGVAIGTIASNGDGVSGHDLIITFNSNATAARVSSLVGALVYSDSASSPNNATRTVQVSVNDGHGQTSTASVSVAISNAALLTASGGSAAFVAADNASSTPITVDSGLTIVDHASATLASGVVTISGNLDSSHDILSFTNSNSTTYGNISASYNSATGVLTLTSSGATATITQWQSALRAVTYSNSAVTPSTATRTVSFLVSDSGSNSSTAVTRTVTVTDVDQTPIVVASGGSSAFVSGDNVSSTPVVVDNGLTLSDGDNSTLASATVSISGNFHSGEDVLAFTNYSSLIFGNIVASYNSATGVLNLSSSGAIATVAQWQAALRSVTYTDTAVTPSTATRTISMVVSDGSKSSATTTRLVTVASTDQTPIVTTSGGGSAFTAGDNTASVPVSVDSGITLSDLDNSTLASATVSITGNFHNAEDVLAFTNTSAFTFGNISASYNSSIGVLSLSSSGATATLAQWQAAMRAVTYIDTAITPVTALRTVSFMVNDGVKSSAVSSRQVSVTAVDQTPIIVLTATPVNYTLGSLSPLVVDSALTLSDSDNSTLASATVAISGNFHSGEDVLAFTNSNAGLYGNISASYNAGSGVMTLSSSGATATVAQWQAALQAVTYQDTSSSPNTATRTIAFTVNDGTKNSVSMVRSLTMALPVPTVGGLTTPTDTGSSHSDGITNDVTPTVTGTAQSSSTVTVWVDGSSVGTTTADGSGQWSYNLSGGVAEGTHNITATATIGGVSSGFSTGYQLVIDTSTPASPLNTALAISSDTGSSHSDGITSNNQPTLTGTAEANSLVTVYIDGEAVGTTTADESGAWSYSLSTVLSDGNHSLRTTATDAAGNISAPSVQRTITVDTQVPATPGAVQLSTSSDTGSSHSDGITSNNQPTLTGTAEANSRVTVYIDGVAVGTATADESGAWRYNLSTALSDGNHSLRTTVTDTAGNISALSAPGNITVDTRAPQIESFSALNPLNGAAGPLSYQLVFNKSVTALTADNLSVITSGSAQGTIASITQLNAITYQIVLNNIGGSGSLSLLLKSGSVSDIAGNLLTGSLSAPVYQITAVTPPTIQPTTPPTTQPTTPPTTSTPVVAPVQNIVSAPIPPLAITPTISGDNSLARVPNTPNIVSATVVNTGTTLSSAIGQAPLSDVGRAAPMGNSFVMIGGTSIDSSGFNMLSVSLTTPAYISSQLPAAGIALQVNPEIGAVPLTSGQSFSIALPPATIMTREAMSSLSISVRQSNGQPLPSWVTFDANTGRFSGQVPAGQRAPISIDIKVVDKNGHSGSSHIVLNVGQKTAVPSAASRPIPVGKVGLDQQIEQHHGSLLQSARALLQRNNPS